MKAVPVMTIVAALAVVGCSRDDSSPAASTSPATTAGPSSTSLVASTSPPTTGPAASTTVLATTTDPAAAHAAVAQAALLTLAEFPSGWTETPYDPASDEESDAVVASVADCAGLDATLIGDAVLGATEAHSPRFESPDGVETVEHIVGFADSEPTAVAAMTALASPALAGCYETAIGDQIRLVLANGELPAGTTIGAITMRRVLDPARYPPEEALRYTASVELIVDGEPLTIWSDLVFLRDSTVLSQLELGGFGEAFPEADIDALVEVAQSRASTAAAS